ncbi:small Trp-rich protein [Paenacidovorax caeni]|jgi:small Trp-rich protein|uniref:Small Trp-rich protein n=1 Tax=Paenacidovorax caeni TaxID=343013 RepID=A0A1I7IFF0_9BURK|nr:TIGR04438 family Trp-rich protein [Paenacidovorax caeni]SFU71659.1 small Trp-rich protein [Paenacidovorax caeni]
MYMLGLALVLTLLKYLEIGPVANWSWWWVLAPYGLTAAWWAWADASGYTKRKEVEKIERRKQARVNKHKEALGMGTRRPR